MAVAPRANPNDYFSAEQWTQLTARSSWRGLWLVAHCWLVIVAAMALGIVWPVLIPLSVLVIGTRQLGFFILMHDAAHALLHPNRKVNDWVGYWLCSAGLNNYRPYHLQHHRFVQQAEDPDLALSAPFPVSSNSFFRKAVRDMSGQTFVKQRFGSLIRRLKSGKENRWAVFTSEVLADRPFYFGNLLGFLVLALAGYWWAWVLMWLLPMMTWQKLVYRIRNIAEHALIAQNEANPLRQARTTHANFFERLFLAPYWVNYHCEHHLFTQVPCWHLKQANRLLVDAGYADQLESLPGYWPLLKRATAAKA